MQVTLEAPKYVLQQGLEGDPDPAILLFFHDVFSSRTSVISIPDTVFFLNTASRTKILANPAFRKGKRGQIPNPVKTFASSRIPHCRSRAAEKSAAF